MSMAASKEKKGKKRMRKAGEQEDAIDQEEQELRGEDRLRPHCVVAIAAGMAAKEASRLRVSREDGQRCLT